MKKNDIQKLLRELKTILDDALDWIRHEMAKHPASEAISEMERNVYRAFHEVPDAPFSRALQDSEASAFGVSGGVFSDTIVFFMVFPDTQTCGILKAASENYKAASTYTYSGLLDEICAREDIQFRCQHGLKWLGHIIICGEGHFEHFQVHIGVVPVGEGGIGRSPILPDKLVTAEEKESLLKKYPGMLFTNVFPRAVSG